MSAPYHCQCGQAIDASTRWQGQSYSIHWWHPETGAEIARCPRCRTHLYTALRKGHLRDAQPAPSTTR